MDEGKVQKTRYAQPSGVTKELRSLLGLASCYRRFIKGFAKIASSLPEQTSEKVEFERTNDMQEALDTFKQALITAPALAYPDFAKPLIVTTDSSKREIGAVLSQKDESGRNHIFIMLAVG